MATRKIILPSPNTVAASSTSLITHPVGRNFRIRAIHLKIGVLSGGTAVAATALPTGAATTAGYVNDIRLKINGKVQRLHSCSELARLNGLNGSGYLPSTWGSRTLDKKWGQVLTIWFAEPWRKSIGQSDALAFPSWMVNSVEVEVDFGAMPTNGSAFVLSAWSEVDGEPASDVHKDGPVISKVFRQNLNGGTAAGSAVDVTSLDRRDLYTTIVADLGNTARPGTAANGITVAAIGDYSAKLKLTANANDVHDVPKDVAALIHAGLGLNASQFDLECVLDSSDDMRSGLQAGSLSDLRCRVALEADTAASANWVLLTERTGPID